MGLRAARVRPGRRAHPGHGLPRAAPAGEHRQRLVPAPDVRGGRGGRRARAAAGDLRRLRRRAAAAARRWSRRTRDAPAPFRNQPHADFSRRENREAYVAALAAVRGRLRRALPAAHRRPRHRDGADARLGEPGGAGRGGRHGRLRRPCRGRSGRRRGARRAAGVARRRAGRARVRALPRRRAHARRDDGALGAHDARGRQDPARGQRRRGRGGRLPRVLRRARCCAWARPGAWATRPASTTSTSTSRAASPS